MLIVDESSESVCVVMRVSAAKFLAAVNLLSAQCSKYLLYTLSNVEY